MMKTSKPGLYDKDGNLVADWQEMVDDGRISVEDGMLLAPMETKFGGYLVLDDSVRAIPREMFLHHEELKGVRLGRNVESIGEGAFDGCKNLEWVEFPKTMHDIGTYAFAGCESLSKLDLPDGITVISDGMAEGCTALRSVDIPLSVKHIGDNAFRDCTSLDEISGSDRLYETLEEIGEGAFLRCPGIKSVSLGEGTAYGPESFDDGVVIKRRGEQERTVDVVKHNVKQEKGSRDLTKVHRRPERQAAQVKDGPRRDLTKIHPRGVAHGGVSKRTPGAVEHKVLMTPSKAENPLFQKPTQTKHLPDIGIGI